ncbi:MAG: hypothetical protein QW701_00515 [Candidatus Nezhaarchaeales archaeon]
MKLVKLRFKSGDVKSYNLDLTLKPSFVSSLYDKEDLFYWVKRVGLYANLLSLRQRNDSLEAYIKYEVDDRIREVILHESGLWDESPASRISKLNAPLKEHIKALTEVFPGVRLSIAPHDFDCILVASILSRRTNYEVFVRKWVKNIWDLWRCDLKLIANLSPSDIKNVGTSYQLLNLIKTLRDYVNMSYRRDKIEDVRRALMLCWGVGPKIADAVLLFTTKSSWIVPCDTHLWRVSRRLGWASQEDRLPTKTLCLSYYCDECVDKYGPCLRETIKSLFPDFGGWIQTLAYLFGSSICLSRKPKCYLCHPTLKECCEMIETRNKLSLLKTGAQVGLKT